MSESFWKRVIKLDGARCWMWQGTINRGGYGTWVFEGKKRTAHRVAWLLTRGPIDGDLEVDHLCRNRRCVNPDHLEPVTHVENMRRNRVTLAAAEA